MGYAAFFLGMLVMGGMVFVMMPKMMFVTKRSRYDFSETIAKLEQSIIQNEWGHKGTWLIHEDLIKKQIDFKTRIANISLCKAPYAAEILSVEKNRFVSPLMPCALSVWEGDDGQVYVSKMNTGLIGPMFGGLIAEIMGKAVSKEEVQILKAIG